MTGVARRGASAPIGVISRRLRASPIPANHAASGGAAAERSGMALPVPGGLPSITGGFTCFGPSGAQSPAAADACRNPAGRAPSRRSGPSPASLADRGGGPFAASSSGRRLKVRSSIPAQPARSPRPAKSPRAFAMEACPAQAVVPRFMFVRRDCGGPGRSAKSRSDSAC